MWKSKGKKGTSDTPPTQRLDKGDDSSRSGARKVALFLSVLEPQTAERLLALFDSDVARIIAEEAKTAECVSSDDVEKIISEFLASVGGAFDVEFADALVAQARSNLQRQTQRDLEKNEQLRHEAAFSDVPSGSGKAVTPLKAVAPETLASLLTEERPATIAVVASLLSEEHRKDFMRRLSPELRAFASRVTIKSEFASSSALKRLEDVLFERAFDD